MEEKIRIRRRERWRRSEEKNILLNILEIRHSSTTVAIGVSYNRIVIRIQSVIYHAPSFVNNARSLKILLRYDSTPTHCSSGAQWKRLWSAHSLQQNIEVRSTTLYIMENVNNTILSHHFFIVISTRPDRILFELLSGRKGESRAHFVWYNVVDMWEWKQ